MGNFELKDIRIIQKHDTEINWQKTTNFIPFKGEIILYDPEPDRFIDNYRIKIGDGIQDINTLPFLALGGESSFDDSDLWKAIQTQPIKILQFQVNPQFAPEGTSIINCNFKWQTNFLPYNLWINESQLIINGEYDTSIITIDSDNIGEFSLTISGGIDQNQNWIIKVQDLWKREAQSQIKTEFLPNIFYGNDLSNLNNLLIKVGENSETIRQINIGNGQYFYIGIKTNDNYCPVLINNDTNLRIPLVQVDVSGYDGYTFWRTNNQNLGKLNFKIFWGNLATNISKFEVTDTIQAKGGNFAVVDSSQISHSQYDTEGNLIASGWLVDFLPHPISIEDYKAAQEAGTLKPNVPYLII